MKWPVNSNCPWVCKIFSCSWWLFYQQLLAESHLTSLCRKNAQWGMGVTEAVLWGEVLPWYWGFWGDKHALNPITDRVKQPFDGRAFLCLTFLVCLADLQQRLAVSWEWLRGVEGTLGSSEVHTRFIWQRRKKTKNMPVANAACPALQRWVKLSLRCILSLSSD